jgi:hypothetical protein
MADIKKLQDVFKTVGLPPYTYVKPPYFGEVRADISQPGKHVLIEGPSGIGKTCVAYKVFEELAWTINNEYSYVSGFDPDANQRINAFFAAANKGETPIPSVIVIDDFHILPAQRRAEIGASLKRMSDRTFEKGTPPKAIMIGIPTTGVSLLSNALDLGPRLGMYALKRVTDLEIDRLISEGEAALNVLFEDRGLLLAEAAGNFWLAQYICNKVCATQEVYETKATVAILTFDLLSIRQRLMDELGQKYGATAKTFAKGKRWRPGGNKPYLEVLLALCKIPESVVPFDKILNVVPERRRPGIRAVRTRISEVIHDQQKNIDLRKQIAFEVDSGFSIEDPLFRYYLSNLDATKILADLGIEQEAAERSRAYTYDVGFSFSGSVRKLVVAINEEMQSEDVITFYDFDQQAFLLAADLETTLAKVYSESCRYYLVFMDVDYRDRVWTKYEKDIMTTGTRKDHIIPVVVDEVGAKGLVGITTTLGRIDLRDVWSVIKQNGSVGQPEVSIIRNRCVLPTLEKLDAAEGSVV